METANYLCRAGRHLRRHPHLWHLGARDAPLQGQILPFPYLQHPQPISRAMAQSAARVTRGSQVLAADAPTGPFKPFQYHSTFPVDMMALDSTLWVEGGVPYMVFCHEWVQIKDGTVEYIQLKEDLSETVGEPVHLFDGSDAAWSRKSPRYFCHVTDEPYLYGSKSGKLFMIWSSGGYTG